MISSTQQKPRPPPPSTGKIRRAKAEDPDTTRYLRVPNPPPNPTQQSKRAWADSLWRSLHDAHRQRRKTRDETSKNPPPGGRAAVPRRTHLRVPKDNSRSMCFKTTTPARSVLGGGVEINLPWAASKLPRSFLACATGLGSKGGRREIPYRNQTVTKVKKRKKKKGKRKKKSKREREKVIAQPPAPT